MGKARDTLRFDQVRRGRAAGGGSAPRFLPEPAMRPLAVLNAIVFGSAAAITFGLGGVLVIFLVLQGQYPQMRSGISCPGSQQRAVRPAGRGFRRQPAGHAEGQAVALAGARRHVAGGRGHSGCCTGRGERQDMGESPKKRSELHSGTSARRRARGSCQRLLTFAQALRFSNAPLLYGSKPLRLPGFFVADDRRAGLLRRSESEALRSAPARPCPRPRYARQTTWRTTLPLLPESQPNQQDLFFL